MDIHTRMRRIMTMPLLPSDIEKLRERGKDNLWEYLWDMRIYDRQG